EHHEFSGLMLNHAGYSPESCSRSEVRVRREDVVDFSPAVVLKEGQRPGWSCLWLGDDDRESQSFKPRTNRRVPAAEVGRPQRPQGRMLVAVSRANDSLRIVGLAVNDEEIAPGPGEAVLGKERLTPSLVELADGTEHSLGRGQIRKAHQCRAYRE